MMLILHFPFMKDEDDDDLPFTIDRPDLSQTSQTSFIYNRNPGTYNFVQQNLI